MGISAIDSKTFYTEHLCRDQCFREFASCRALPFCDLTHICHSLADILNRLYICQTWAIETPVCMIVKRTTQN